MLNRLAAKLGSKAKKEEVPEHDEDEVSTPNFTLDHVKHPPPELPPCPAGLTPLQVACCCIYTLHSPITSYLNVGTVFEIFF